MSSLHKALIYIFAADDCRSIEQRLHYAVSDFSNSCGMDIPPPEILRVARLKAGKPYFPDCPQVQFSISHSGKYWSCAVADQVIGYDLQERDHCPEEPLQETIQRHQKMANRFFHPLEAEFVSLDCRQNFLTVWTAREAYVKHTGQGIDIYFSEHCVIPDDKTLWQDITGYNAECGWIAMNKVFWKSGYGNDYTLCVCTEEPCDCAIITCTEDCHNKILPIV